MKEHELLDFSGKVALVTGARRGIGEKASNFRAARRQSGKIQAQSPD